MVRRLLIVSSQVRSVYSGVGTYAAMIIRGLAGAAATVEVTVATWSSEIDRGRYPDLQWLDLGEPPRRDPTPGRFFTLGRRLLDALGDRPGAFDVVHFLDAREGHAFVGSRHRGVGRVIGTVHDDYAAQVSWNPLHYVGRAADPIRRFLFHRWLRWLERRCYRKFDLLMCNADATSATVRDAYDLDESSLQTISLTVEPGEGGEGVDEGDPQERSDTEGRLEGSPSLVFCGGNFYRKGLDVCVQALPALLVAHPRLKLHVLGSCASAARIEAKARRLGVAGAVEFHGHVPPDLAAAMMAGADIFLMPSRTEALGLVYLEAMRAGVPVIAGNRGRVTEIVEHDRSGLLVEPDSPAAIVEAVDKLARDPAVSGRLVAGGRATLARRTPERLIRETLTAYGLRAAVGSRAAAAEIPETATPPTAGATRAAEDRSITAPSSPITESPSPIGVSGGAGRGSV